MIVFVFPAYKQFSIVCPKALVLPLLVFHLDDDDTNGLVVLFRGYLCNVPIRRKEYEEPVGCAVMEQRLFDIIVIMDNISTIAGVGLARIMVDQSETFCAFHHQLEINVMKMALAPTFFQRFVVAILNTCH